MCFRKYLPAIIIVLHFSASQVFPQNNMTPSSSFLGTHNYERVGYYMHSAGDMNSDGYDDFMIGAFHNDRYEYNNGVVYLMMGKSDADWGHDISLNNADAIFLGSNAHEAVGYYLGGNGDINGDGFDDIVIAAGGGYIYLVFGKSNPDWGTSFRLKSSADASYIQENEGDFQAVSAAIVGDINGDGYDDFICGAPFNDYGGEDGGKAYLLLGKASGWDRNDDIADADASFYCGIDGYRLGYSVDGLGDVNGDGIPDFGILADWGGKVYIFFGRREVDWGRNTHVDNADVILEREPEDSWYLWRVSRAGDVNKDGYDDILVGEPWNDKFGDSAGKVHLIFGRSSGWPSNLADADASFHGEAVGDEAGWDVQDAGDVDGDGYDDFLIGAWYNDQNGEDAGKMYVIKGKSSSWQQNVSLAEIDEYFVGEHPGDYAGYAVATAGDVNADGLNDIFTSATYYSEVYEWGGKIYFFKSNNSDPVLSVNPTQLDFGGGKTSLSFEVSNSGGGTLEWEALENPDESWIVSVSPSSGNLGGGGSQLVTVTVDRTGLSEGEYSGTITVTSNGGTQDVLISMSVPGPPALSVNPTQLDFGANQTSMTFEVKNSGGDVLDWSAYENPDEPWMTSISPESGSLIADETVIVTVNVDRNGMEEGDYSGIITVTSNGGEEDIVVTMTVDPTPAYAQRVNCGAGSGYTDGEGYYWDADQAYSSGNWGYIGGRTYSTSNSIAGTDDDELYQRERWEASFSYRFDVTNGSYNVILHFAEIYHQAAGRRIFDVSLEENIVLDNYDIFAEIGHDVATSKSYMVEVNDGVLDIDFTATEDAGKISAIEVISSSSMPTDPVLSVEPTTLNFGTSTSSMTFTVTNDGGGTLEWNAAENPDETWITSVSPSGGTLAGGYSETVTVNVDRIGLEPGEYTGNITVTSNGGDQNITVIITVPSTEPILTVDPTSLDFGTTAISMNFTVSNTGGGTLDWNAAENPDESWITSVSPSSGSLNEGESENVFITVNRDGLAEGSYSGNISVTSNGGDQDVAIYMTVPGSGPADVLYVKHPGDSPNAWENRSPIYTSINDAINFATENSEIWVAQGHYTEHVMLTTSVNLYGCFYGDETSIEDRGDVLDRISTTVIDGTDDGRCITVSSNCLIDGFKLINGKAAEGEEGGGILIENSTNVTVRNVYIQSCDADWGAGIMVDSSNQSGEILIERAVIWDCTSQCGALEIREEATVTVTVSHCTIVNNNSYGLEIPWHEGVEVANTNHDFYNCIIWGSVNPRNPNSDYPDVWSWARDYTDYSYIGREPWPADPDRWGAPLPNNIFEVNVGTPGFVDADNGNFHLTASSPCINAGKDGADMGAYDYHSTTEPEIAVNPTLLSFSATEGGENPGSQIITVTNAGAGELSWTASEHPEEPWMSLSNTSGGSGDQVTVSVNTEGLALGTYESAVRISDPNAINDPVDVPVTLTVSEEPSSSILAEWQAEDSPSLPNTGWEVMTNENQLCVKALTSDIEGPNDDYRLDYSFNVSSGITTVYVFAEVDANRSGDDDSFWIQMNGSDLVKWNGLRRLDDGWQRSWIYDEKVDDCHAFQVESGSNTLNVYPRENGIHMNWLVITTDPNLDIEAYQLGSEPPSDPIISVDPSELSFTAVEGGDDPADQTITVTNSGGGTLSWTAVESPEAAWLELTNSSGGTGDKVTVSVSITGLGKGTYETNVRISDPNASNDPVDVPVTLSVTGEPTETILAEWQAEDSPSLPNSGWENVVNDGESCLMADVNDLEGPSGVYQLDYAFTVPEGVTTIYVFAEIDANHSGNDDSFWIQMNGADDCKWNGMKRLPDGWQRSWVYDEKVDEQHAFEVTAGENILNLYPRETHACINWLVITTDPNLDIETYIFNGSLAKKLHQDQFAREEQSSPIIPEQFKLHQNFPNPFNPTTTIAFDIPVDSDVKLIVYNSLGQEIKQLMNGFHSAGKYSITWNGQNARAQPVGNGMYLVLLHAGEFHKTIKMTLIR